MAEQSLDFGFITDDVKRQRELAQDALDEAKRITKIIEDNPDIPHKTELQEAAARWINIARSLATNAATTSTAASAAISNIKTFVYR